MNKTENVALPEGFTQVCVWPGTLVEESQIEDFENFLLEQTGSRVKFLETIVTGPDLNDPTSGGRHDVFFTVNSEDIGKFSIPRLQIGIRWIEDVLSRVNYRDPIYPERVFQYISWDANSSFEPELEGDDNE